MLCGLHVSHAVTLFRGQADAHADLIDSFWDRAVAQWGADQTNIWSGDLSTIAATTVSAPPHGNAAAAGNEHAGDTPGGRPAGASPADGAAGPAPGGEAEAPHRHLAHTWQEAWQLAFDCATPIPAAPVALRDALGRQLAADVEALVDMPHYASSAMDGWAVNGSGPWILAESGQRLAPHQASPIATGGLIALITATDAAEDGRSKMIGPLKALHYAAAEEEINDFDVPHFELLDSEQMGLALGMENVIHAALTRGAAAQAAVEKARRLALFIAKPTETDIGRPAVDGGPLPEEQDERREIHG